MPAWAYAPAKLAQIIINLAAGPARDGQLTILDPFCGTGVVLQEALLMGYNAYGTDLEPRMIAYTTENLQWLSTTYNLPPTTYNLETGDATTHHWNFPNIQDPPSTIQQPTFTIDIACETYLGRPFTERPSSAILAQTATEVKLILKRFLPTYARSWRPPACASPSPAGLMAASSLPARYAQLRAALNV
jgi:SAM-dependent methyltransferase